MSVMKHEVLMAMAMQQQQKVSLIYFHLKVSLIFLKFEKMEL